MATTPISRLEADTRRLPLLRHVRTLTLATGSYLAGIHLALLVVVDRDDLERTVADPLHQGLSVAYAGAFPLLIITVVALYELHARSAGAWGVAGICGAVLGTFAMGANMWFEALAVPWMVDVAPKLLHVDKSGGWIVGYSSSYALFAAGCVLFGYSAVRAGVLPRAPSIAVMAAGIVGFLAASPPYAVPLGFALVWTGLRLPSGRTRRSAG